MGATLNGKVFDKNNSQFTCEAQLRYQLVLLTSLMKKNSCEGKKKRQEIKPKKNDEAQKEWVFCTLDGLQPLHVLCDVTLPNH